MFGFEVKDFPMITELIRLISCLVYGTLLCFCKPVVSPWAYTLWENSALQSVRVCIISDQRAGQKTFSVVEKIIVDLKT